MIFDNEFDAEDAALYGGILGFVDESAKAEEDSSINSNLDEPVEYDIDSCSADVQMRLLYNENPGLVRFLIKKARDARSRDNISIDEIEAVRKEMLEEIQEQEQSENTGADVP